MIELKNNGNKKTAASEHYINVRDTQSRGLVLFRVVCIGCGGGGQIVIGWLSGLDVIECKQCGRVQEINDHG